MLKIAINNHMSEYGKVIRLADEAISCFDRKPYRNHFVTQVFYYSLLTDNFNKKAYSRCRQIAIQRKRVFLSGSYNWFRWQKLYLLAELHAGQYDAAISIWIYTTAQSEYPKQPSCIRDFWETTLSYLQLLIRCQKIKGKKAEQIFLSRQIGKSIFQIDWGNNSMDIPAMLIQYLTAISVNNVQQRDELQGFIVHHRTNYLNSRKTPRTCAFFRLLELLPLYSSNKKTIICKSATQLKKLYTHPMQAANQDMEVEIIPYEILWALTVEMLYSEYCVVEIVE